VLLAALMPHIFGERFFGRVTFWMLGIGLLGWTATVLLAASRGALSFKKRLDDPTSRKHYHTGLIAVLVILTIVVLSTKHSESGVVTLIHYAATISAICTVGFCVSSIARRRWVAKLGMGLSLVLAVAWWNFDYSIQKWSTESEYTKNTSRYSDYFRRLADKPYYRKYSMYTEGGLAIYRSEGRLTDTGKQHGKWPWRSIDWSPFNVETGNDFYWYGEKITEGEWHLRNK